MGSIFRYQNTWLRPGARYDWVVLHKGRLTSLEPGVVRELLDRHAPVLANEVFVVLGSHDRVPDVMVDSVHVRPLLAEMQNIADHVAPAEFATRHGAGDDAASVTPHDVLPDPGVLKRMALMSRREFVAAMDAFFLAGGYEYVTLRDAAYYAEIDQYIEAYVGTADGLEVLDLCCGMNRLGNLLRQAAWIVGVDISGVAVAKARRTTDDGRFSFFVGDAHHLAFGDETFDQVLLVDAAEHVADIERTIAEVARVTRGNGKLFLTAANTDSLNQVISRKLGTGEFVTNYQHVREFSYPEMKSILGAHGFQVIRAGGLFLYPYWGIPGVDQYVRSVTDGDREVVDLTRRLGRLVGPEHAYSFALLASKTST